MIKNHMPPPKEKKRKRKVACFTDGASLAPPECSFYFQKILGLFLLPGKWAWILSSYFVATPLLFEILRSVKQTFGKCIKTQTVEQCRILCKTALKFFLWMAVFRDKDFSSLASQSVLQKNELLVWQDFPNHSKSSFSTHANTLFRRTSGKGAFWSCFVFRSNFFSK